MSQILGNPPNNKIYGKISDLWVLVVPDDDALDEVVTGVVLDVDDLILSIDSVAHAIEGHATRYSVRQDLKCFKKWSMNNKCLHRGNFKRSFNTNLTFPTDPRITSWKSPLTFWNLIDNFKATLIQDVTSLLQSNECICDVWTNKLDQIASMLCEDL